MVHIVSKEKTDQSIITGRLDPHFIVDDNDIACVTSHL